MKAIKELFIKSLSQKYMGKKMIGTLAIQIIQKFFKDSSIQGYIKFNILYINTNKHEIKTKSFKHKNELMKQINKELSNIGYQIQVKDIRFINKLSESN